MSPMVQKLIGIVQQYALPSAQIDKSVTSL